MKFTEYIKRKILTGDFASGDNPFIDSKDGLRCKYDEIRIEGVVGGQPRVVFRYRGKDMFFRDIDRIGHGDTLTLTDLDGSVGFVLS